ncbi:hypothetical protein BC936DRAFT_142646 [Jimgerdemannia flammicorona]|uniref:Uncharacterized protein n=1 Tax=Jimgerdemannia flammicorona TaxID=994334 RepID=A0A433DEU8_9FUNG|nr:hypothetical protein BC936DRAFT_142646 [Jimgerdemannia flammicorona]
MPLPWNNGSLLIEIIFAKREHGYKTGSISHSELNESEALAQGEVACTRASIERFRGAADDDDDGGTGPLVENVLAGCAGDGGAAHGHEIVTVEGEVEVGGQRQKTRLDAREFVGETCGLCREVGEGTHGDDAVGVVAEDIVLGGVELGFLVGRVEERGREVVRIVSVALGWIIVWLTLDFDVPSS